MRRTHRRAVRPCLEGLEPRLTPTTLPPGFVESAVVAGLSAPTAMEFSPDGRLFVLEQGGRVKLVRADGTTWTALQLNVNSQGERGLLGIAFDPSFNTNKFVYLYYTNPNSGTAPWATGIHNQISRFTVNDANPQQPLFTNEAPILDLNSLTSASNHNGGAIHFGVDGKLHATPGDNVQTFTQGGQTYRVSQSLATLLGKQLRIDVASFNAGIASRNDTTVGRLIPSDNPFVTTATGINRLIYGLGLRNVFAFAVQPGTGRMFLNDVGETSFEEINQAAPGANFGWSGGNTDGFGQSPPGPGIDTDPVLAYAHSGGLAGGGCAIVGGAFYNPTTVSFPSTYLGKYFYGDLCGNYIRVFDPATPGSAANPDTSTAFATNLPGGLRDLKVDAAGNLYYLAGTGGVVNRIFAQAQGQSPQITTQPTSQTISQGQNATFTVVATGTALHYQWQHQVGANWTNVGTDAATLTIVAATLADAGSHRVVVSNTLGSVVSNTATLTVIAPQSPPQITRQPVSQSVDVGATVVFSVAAVGTLPLSHQWQHLVGANWVNVGANAAGLSVGPVTPADAGSYRVVVRNNAGVVTSNTATLAVNQGPAITIDSPALGSRYDWGQSISFAGSATDAEDGPVDPSKLVWQVLFVRADNAAGAGLRAKLIHTAVGVAGGAFVAAEYETSPFAFYRVYLTAVDSRGVGSTRFIDVQPNTVRLTLATDPPGLPLALEGKPVVGGTVVTSVVGLPRVVGATTSPRIGTATYAFTGWLDGGAPLHVITTPATDLVLTARYALQVAPGLRAEFFDLPGNVNTIPNLAQRVANVTRTDATIDYPATTAAWPGLDNRFVDTFATRHAGYVRIETGGAYTFFLGSNDGSRLWIDGALVVDNNGTHPFRERSATVTLAPGYHAIRVEFFENSGLAGLTLSWSGPGIAKQIVPADRLYQDAPAPAAASIASALAFPQARGPRRRRS